ncbi:single-stranded DNA-binding protein [Edaphobacter modestus]|uniref:single-stranded DNA-binding protein n=1 Tax=Edaphobacter modestus TaxID=388466 RepID=UPI0026A65E4A
MFNKVILIGRLGQNAEAKTAQNNNEYVILNIATQESWKNDKGDYEILCANSSQAKGRVERVNRTLQDRLVKELRLDNVCDIQAGNDFLPEFLNRFNEKFSVQAAKPEDLHRRLNLSADRLSDMLPPSVQSIIHAEGVRCRGCGSVRTMSGSSSRE